MYGLENLDESAGIATFTDGSSNVKDGSGGWSWLAFDAFENETIACNSGGASDTTNNRMEMMAWIESLNSIYNEFGPCSVIVYSDSQYVGFGAMDRTRKRNKNVDLWLQIDQAIDKHRYVEFTYVKGHSGKRWNEEADAMAGAARIDHLMEQMPTEAHAIMACKEVISNIE